MKVEDLFSLWLPGCGGLGETFKALLHAAVHLLEECLPNVRKLLPLTGEQVFVLVNLVLHVQELALPLTFLLHKALPFLNHRGPLILEEDSFLTQEVNVLLEYGHFLLFAVFRGGLLFRIWRY